MAEAIHTDSDPATAKRGRGPAKAFPTSTFRETIILASGIAEHGFNGSIRRVLLFDKLRRSPDSSVSQTLVANSHRYGLTTGSSRAEFLAISPDAVQLLSLSSGSRGRREKEFALAVGGIAVFAKAYEHLKNQRVPTPDVLKDELRKLGVPPGDTEVCAQVLVGNLRSLGLIRELSGIERVIPLDEVTEQVAPDDAHTVEELKSPGLGETENTAATTPLFETPKPELPNARPSLHIDVQIHIDPSSTAEQIDHIFESMARHLYGK